MILLRRSFIYNIKSTGPKTDPCGTPNTDKVRFGGKYSGASSLNPSRKVISIYYALFYGLYLLPILLIFVTNTKEEIPDTNIFIVENKGYYFLSAASNY